MEFVANRKRLLASIDLAEAVVDPKAGLPVLSTVRLEARAAGTVGLYTTDLVRSYEGDLSVDVRRPGGVCVDVKALRAMLANATSEMVTLDTTDALQVRISMERVKARLYGLKPDDMPTAPVFGGPAAQVDAPTLWRVLGLLLPAVSSDPTRPHLNAVLFEPGAAAATNGHAANAFDGAVGVPPMLLPAAAARAWHTALKGVEGSVVVRTGGNGAHVALETPAGRFSSKTVDAHFPSWRAIVPRESGWTTTLDAKALRAACAGMPCEKIKLIPGKDEVTVESEDVEGGRFRAATVAWSIDRGAPVVIGFSAALLQGALRTEGKVTLHGTGELDPLVVRHLDEASFVGVVAPMRV